jgi:pyridoxal phosphate enzyme (YggS family)
MIEIGQDLDPDGLAARVDAIRNRVAIAANHGGRDADDITIVAVCKTFPRTMIDAAYEAGLRIFAENRVQEARDKFAEPLPIDASVHLVGQLQSNKVKQAIGLFSCIESVDRESLVEALEREAAKRDVIAPVLLQVNIAREAQKSGCDPDQAGSLLDLLAASPHLRCDGLMTIAPFVEDAEETRVVFRDLHLLREEFRQRHPSLPLDILSMGMSNDFEVAIAEGATHIRIGRALFGQR